VIRSERLRERLAPLLRTVESVFPEEELLAKLDSGNLARLQAMGHVAVLILGDATALVGDPSGKDKTRPMLTKADVEANLETWLWQIGHVLDLGKAEIRRNSEWFETMTLPHVLDLANRMTVQQMMERDSFQKRWQAAEPISVRELLYCLMQGWDSVQVRADVELGGTDQTFNLTVGRKLMAQEGLEPQVCLISPLLEGTDGQAKMSKSLGNAIGLREPPKDMFGLAMRVSDDLTPKYLRLATDVPDAEIERLLAGPPMEAKLAMAEALVLRHHGPEVARAQRTEFERVFRSREAPSVIPDVAVGAPGEDGRHWVVDLLKVAGFAGSTGEARRLVEGGGVRLDEATVADWHARIAVAGGEVLRVGRRRYARLVRS
jgi:tyrosyl-tRNA synthetase